LFTQRSAKTLEMLAGVEAVALSRRFNQFVQGEGRFRPIDPANGFSPFPSPPLSRRALYSRHADDVTFQEQTDSPIAADDRDFYKVPHFGALGCDRHYFHPVQDPDAA
jgi:hypothetical protein